jgi:hypothetical protein
MPRIVPALLGLVLLAVSGASAQVPAFSLNEHEYFECGGVNVMAFQDIYPDGHQAGVSVIQHAIRLATNGDIRLETTPGQWSPMPHQLDRVVDRETGSITTTLAYPDPSKDRTGFNPIEYPDLALTYRVTVRAEGDAVRVRVDLDEPLPDEWIGRVGFNMELFPGAYFGQAWYLGGTSGHFPMQPNGPSRTGALGSRQPVEIAEPVALATGRRLSVAPGSDDRRMTVESLTGALSLYDGRIQHNNGWFVVREPVSEGAAAGAVEWIVRPHAVPGWMYEPVIQVSQVGYHPDQSKVAVVELDARDDEPGTTRVHRVGEDGALVEVLSGEAAEWGRFLRYDYRTFDFTSVREPGMYLVTFRDRRSGTFRIDPGVFDRHVWQPTLEYFLPVQMCHMRVEEQYRVWHGACHLDDARMAPADTNHFDGYVQGPDLLTAREPGRTVPGLDVGGWHDAGDDDLRIESQADEVYVLATAYEEFGVEHDETTIDQAGRIARIHQPDGRPDILQQVEHGVLNILGGYRGLGRLYRGVIVPTLKQYVLLGDVVNSTDNLFHDPSLAPGERTATHSPLEDDRWVFTESHSGHEYKGIAALAAAARVLRGYDADLARECLETAEAIWRQERDPSRNLDERLVAATELFLATGEGVYREALVDLREHVLSRIGSTAWALGRALPSLGDADFEAAVRSAVADHFRGVREAQAQNPYGVPYRPHIWGAGWGIQRFGVEQYFLHRAFPESVSAEYMLNALNFVLGVHPGLNTASFASGVGARSATVGYGLNRADWSYIPGGVVSGTALIRPDFPELKEFPYLWQQVEYVMGGGATHFMFLVLAAQREFGP